MGHEVVNGVRLYYQEHGQGQPILCIHGTSSSAMVWAAAVESLAQLGRVIVYDRRGCTRSERPEPYETTSVCEHAEDAAALLRALGGVPAVLIGRSYGGDVALDLAIRSPDVVRALVLLEATPLGLDSEADGWAARLTADVLEVAKAQGVKAVAEALFRPVLGDEGWESLPAEWQQMFIDNGQAILAELRGGDLKIDPASLAGITQPTLLLAADDSPEPIRRLTQVMAQTIPNARMSKVAGGHLISPNEPAVLAFLRECIKE